MRRIFQVDIARQLGVDPNAISRALKAMGRQGEPLSEHTVLALLTAGEINRLGLAWTSAIDIAFGFEGEILYCAHHPDHRAWLVLIEKPDTVFWVSCLSASHLDSVLSANPLSTTLALHEPTALALEQAHALQQLKGAA